MKSFIDRFNIPSAGRWFMLGIFVGLISGLGAIIFYFILQFCSFFFLDYLAGFRLIEPSGERLLFGHGETELKRYLLFIIPASGGLISGLLVYFFAPEAGGHGTDAAINAIHKKNGEIRVNVPIIKMIASAITIGSGGSGGREGPIAQIGAGFGYFIARILKLTERERRILTAAGMGAGIGAIFKSPLAGAIFAAEVLYSSSDMEYEILLPSTITSIVAYSVFCSVFGWQPLFSPPDFVFSNPLELISYTILGGACAIFGYIYVNVFYGIRSIFKRINVSGYFKPMIGGFITGSLGFFIPQALGGGYDSIEKAFNLEYTAAFLVVLIFAKTLTTSFTIGSGGSAGVFGPSVVIGACVGGLVGIVINNFFPVLVVNPGSFAIVGMAGFFAGIAKTPLSTIIMVSEMTGNYNLLVPSMWVSTISFLLLRKTGIYKSQVYMRGDSPVHRGEFLVSLLQNIRVENVMRKDPVVIDEGMKFVDLVHFISTTKHNSFPVVNKEKILIGVLRFEEIREFVFKEGLENIVVAGEICDKHTPILLPSDNLAHTIEILGFSNIELLPVVNKLEDRIISGIITRRDIIAVYNKELKKQKLLKEPEF